jgi:predicted GIY-YIG superfamily endonuclease
VENNITGPVPKVRRVSPSGNVRYHRPSDPAAVYRIKNANGVTVYIGASHEPAERVDAHLRTQTWREDIVTWSAEWYPSWAAAHRMEVAAIEQEKPVHNIVHTPLHRERALARRVELTRDDMNRLSRQLDAFIRTGIA